MDCVFRIDACKLQKYPGHPGTGSKFAVVPGGCSKDLINFSLIETLHSSS
jgi:hypothetical protein